MSLSFRMIEPTIRFGRSDLKDFSYHTLVRQLQIFSLIEESKGRHVAVVPAANVNRILTDHTLYTAPLFA